MAGTQWAFNRCVFLNKEIKLVQKVSMFRRIDFRIDGSLTWSGTFNSDHSPIPPRILPQHFEETLPKSSPSPLLSFLKKKKLLPQPLPLSLSCSPLHQFFIFHQKIRNCTLFFQTDRCLHRGRRVRWGRDWGSLHRRDRRASVFFILCCLSPR